jgi:diguanylate cyclase (GGDEF)-like protein
MVEGERDERVDARAVAEGEWLRLNITETKILRACLARFRDTFRRQVVDIVREQMRGFEPPEVREVIEELEVVSSQLGRGARAASVHPIHARLLKHMILNQRRELARAAEGPRHMTAHKGAIRYLERETGVLETMMAAAWFLGVQPAKIPRLTDFMSIRYAEEALGGTLKLAPREYDEKFHILEAPSLLLPDISYYRARCALRSSGFAVAYLDIDDFKDFNTRYSEMRVDRDLLPRLMEVLEAHMFAHGHAYRFGGDEYPLLVPNVERAQGLRFLCELQDRLAVTEYIGIEHRPTISIGLCHVSVDCPLTDIEIVEHANKAERFAKRRRKGSIAFYQGDLYRALDLELSPARASR